MKKYLFIISILMMAVYTSCIKDSNCDYEVIEPCEEVCNMFEDFESYQVGNATNWVNINASVPEIVENNGNKSLHIRDQSGGSWLYSTDVFPANLLEQGCKLKYDVIYITGGAGNSATTDNSITIFQGGSPVTATIIASFVLNSTHVIPSNVPFTTIEVPLELASGTTLPSNNFGEWRMAGGPPYSAAQINDFNDLIQNISGVGFFLDEGSNPSEEWYFDNFCFQNCCDIPFKP
jgi:hypothetical protein